MRGLTFSYFNLYCCYRRCCPKLLWFFGLKKFKKSCKILVVSDERRQFHTVHERNWVDCLPKTEQFAKLYLLDDKTDQNTNLPCQISYLYRYTLFSQIWVNEKKLRKQNSSLFLTLIVHILINVHKVPFERQITNWFCIEQLKSDHYNWFQFHSPMV